MNAKLERIGRVVALGALIASNADALVMVQAAAGHPHLSSGTVAWTGEWTDTGWDITDGRSIGRLVQESNSPDYWDTMLPVDNTNVNRNVVAYATLGGTTTLKTRICTFTSTGAFSSCGSWANPGSVSTALIPTNGAAYAQSEFSCTGAGGFCTTVGTATLHHVKYY